MELTSRKVLVLGSGVSGIGASELLDKAHAEITIWDGNKNLRKADVEKKLPEGVKAEIIIGELGEEILSGMELAVLSPGIAIDAPVVEQVRATGIPIWGEIELAYRMGHGRVAAITGTNGKTTTTALTGEIFKNYYKETYVVGNIGIPYTHEAWKMTEDAVTAAEISSFQLESIDAFHPTVSACLNITPDHLNRHYTMENYTAVKLSITKNQTASDVCVLNYEDARLRDYDGKITPAIYWFSSRRKVQQGVWYDGETMILSMNGCDTPVLRSDEMQLVGIHNVENAMAAIAIAYAMGVPLDIIRKTIREFKAVEHRIEYTATKKGVIYYNDSKGTNTDASIKAIEAMTNPTILIAGGYDKGSSYDDWFDAFNGKIKKLVLLGQTKEKIAAAADAHGYKNYVMTESLEEAVGVCADSAAPGDVVLLSPACASWGMFKNYEERGRLFKELVSRLED